MHSLHVCVIFVSVCVCVTCYMLIRMLSFGKLKSAMFSTQVQSHTMIAVIFMWLFLPPKICQALLCTIAIVPRLVHLRLNNKSLFIGPIMDEIPTINHVFLKKITP